MKRITLLPILFFFGFILKAQSPIVLQNPDGVFIHTRLDTIMAHAKNGCSIYLPGGTLILNKELIINKEVHIYGAGHYPDSSAATGITYISGAIIRFTTGSAHSSLTGFYFNNDLYFARGTTDTLIIMVEGPNSLNKNDYSSLRVYPVPATDRLNFDYDGGSNSPLKVSVADMQGRFLLLEKIVEPGSSLDISMLPPGEYFVLVKIRKQVTMLKVIKLNN